MNIKKLAALAGVSMAILGAGIILPSAANAATVSPDGLNTCKVTYTKHYRAGCIQIKGEPDYCSYYTKTVSCTRY